MAKILFVLFCIFVINYAEDVKKDLSKEEVLNGQKNWPKPVGPAIGDISDNEDSDSEWFPNVDPITKPDLDIGEPWNKPSVGELPWPPKKPDNSLPWSIDPGKDKPWVPSVDSDLNKPNNKPWVPSVNNDLNKPWNNKPVSKPWNKPTTREPWVDDEDVTKKPWGSGGHSDEWDANKPWNTKPEGNGWNPIRPWESKPPIQKPQKPQDEDIYIEEAVDEEYESGDEEEPDDHDENWEQVNPQKRPQHSTVSQWGPNKKPPQPFYPETKPDQIGKPQQGKPWNKPGKPSNGQSDPWSSGASEDYPAWADHVPKPVNKPKPKPSKPKPTEADDDQFEYPNYEGLAHKPEGKPKREPQRPYYKPDQSWGPWNKNNKDGKKKIDLYKQPIDNKAQEQSTPLPSGTAR